MIVSVKGFARTYSHHQIRGEMGQSKPTELQWDYDKTSMWLILGISLGVALVGLVTLITAVVHNNMKTLTFGIAMFAVGTYQSISTIKEKSNLDLLSSHFGTLSESAKNEILKSLVDHNASASRGLLEFIETLFKRNDS